MVVDVERLDMLVSDVILWKKPLISRSLSAVMELARRLRPVSRSSAKLSLADFELALLMMRVKRLEPGSWAMIWSPLP